MHATVWETMQREPSTKHGYVCQRPVSRCILALKTDTWPDVPFTKSVLRDKEVM
jgi:hypothetical protein